MTTLTDLSNTVFNDNLYISSFASSHSVILSRKNDATHPQDSSLFDIFDADAQADIQKHLASFVTKPLLCASRSGPAIIFNFLYHSTLTFLTSLPDVNTATALAYAKETDSLIIADSLKDKSLDGADEKKFFMLDDILKRTYTPLIKAATYIPLSSGDILEDMLTQAKAISELCGCGAEITKSGSLTLSSEERRATEVDLALYTAALVVLLLLARHFSADRRAGIDISLKEESPFVTVSFEPIQSERQTENDRFTKELFYIRSVFGKLKALFYTADEDKTFSVCFSPVRADWSLLGIKNEDGELIFDVDPIPCDD